MWKRVYSKIFPGVKKEDVWRIWTDITNWPRWHGDLDYCRIEGEFAVGNHFILKPKGMGPVKILLTEINEKRDFTDCTKFFGAKMYDTHSMEETPAGLRLTNTLVVTGPLKWLWIWLVARHVANTIPEETEALVGVARKASAHSQQHIKGLPFGFAKPEDSPGFMLWQTTMTWQRQIKKALEEYGISHQQFVIMATLLWFEAHGYDTTQVLIAKWSKLDKMTVSKSLQKLGQLGYVKRIEHEADARAKNTTLSKQGRALLNKLVPVVEGIDKAFFSRLSEAEQADLLRFFAKLAVDEE